MARARESYHDRHPIFQLVHQPEERPFFYICRVRYTRVPTCYCVEYAMRERASAKPLRKRVFHPPPSTPIYPRTFSSLYQLSFDSCLGCVLRDRMIPPRDRLDQASARLQGSNERRFDLNRTIRLAREFLSSRVFWRGLTH